VEWDCNFQILISKSQEKLNASDFRIFGYCMNILQVFKVKAIESPTLDTRVIHD
jgi:hypothetical protein